VLRHQRPLLRTVFVHQLDHLVVLLIQSRQQSTHTYIDMNPNMAFHHRGANSLAVKRHWIEDKSSYCALCIEMM
jgi:tRNA(Ile2) C34 agmatinyltransferase TiaS